jgi:hypothetical protein
MIKKENALTLFVILTYLPLIAPDNAYADYHQWKYSRPIVVNTTSSGANVVENQTAFPLLVRLSNDNFNFNEAKARGEDIRFSDHKGKSLPYEIVSYNKTGGCAAIYVRSRMVPGNSITDNIPTNITMHWGNSRARSESNHEAVFARENGFVLVLHLDWDGTAGPVLKGGGWCPLSVLPAFRAIERGVNLTPFMMNYLYRESSAGSCKFWNKKEDPVKEDFTFSWWSYSPVSGWSYFAFVSDKGKCRFYKNGTEAPLWQTIGFPRAVIGEVTIANTARSAGWIKLCWENQKERQCAVGIGQTPVADSDGDGVPDFVEIALGYDPFDAKSRPNVAIPGRWSDVDSIGFTPVMSEWLNTGKQLRQVTFFVPFSTFSPYAMTLPAGVVVSEYIPIVEFITESSVPPYPHENNVQMIMAYNIKGGIASDSSLLFPFPYPTELPRKIGMSTFKLVRFNEQTQEWEDIRIESVTQGIIWARIKSFSKYLAWASTGNIIFVDSLLKSVMDGKDWSTAFNNLEDALSAAVNITGTKDIWVARGTYKPGLNGERDKSFNLIQGISLLGGFAGNEFNYYDRKPEVNKSVLSGDLDGDEARSDNDAYHVITLIDTSGATGAGGGIRIDGFTIEGGNADGPDSADKNGGAVYIASNFLGQYYSGNGQTIANCLFRNNFASFQGGAVYKNVNSCSYDYPDRLYLLNCTFNGNRAGSLGVEESYGGALYTESNCCYYDKYLRHYSPYVEIEKCAFLNDTAYGGGAISFNDFASIIKKCLFHNNCAAYLGGAIYYVGCGPVSYLSFYDTIEHSIESSVFCLNNVGVADAWGGAAIMSMAASVRLANCTIFNNESNGASTNYCSAHGSFYNCIFWDNRLGAAWSDQIRGVRCCTLSVKNCDIMNGIDKINVDGNSRLIDLGGNISQDPLFVDTANVLGSDNRFGTFDDGLMLLLGSPCHRAGDSAAAPSSDVIGTPKPTRYNPDIGAYYMFCPENQKFAVDFFEHPETGYGFDKILPTDSAIFNPDSVYISLAQAAGSQTKTLVAIDSVPQNYYAQSSDQSVFTIESAISNRLPFNNRNISEVTLVSQNPDCGQYPPCTHASARLQIMDESGQELRALNVEVYKERVLHYTFNRVVDESSPLTWFLYRSKDDVEALFNNCLKQAVLRLECTTFNGDTNIPFDINKNGSVDNYDIYRTFAWNHMPDTTNFTLNPEPAIIKAWGINDSADTTFSAYRRIADLSLIIDADANAGDTCIILNKESYYVYLFDTSLIGSLHWIIGPASDGSGSEPVQAKLWDTLDDGRTRFTLKGSGDSAGHLKYSYRKTLQPDPLPSNPNHLSLTGASISYSPGTSYNFGGGRVRMICFEHGDVRETVGWPHEIFHMFQSLHTKYMGSGFPDNNNLMYGAVGSGATFRLRSRPIKLDYYIDTLFQQWDAVNR